MSIKAQLLKVTEDAQKIEKKGYNNYSKYNYVRAVDVIEEVKKLLVKHGITLTISEDSIERIREGSNFHTTLKSTATFGLGKYTESDPPNVIEDSLSVSYYSVSADTLDKDIFKAKTNGLKYLFTQMFLIVTADVIDTEETSNNVQPKQNYNASNANVAGHKKESANVGHFTVSFGKFKGQPLTKENINQVNDYCKFLETSSDKPPSKNVMDLRFHINKFMGVGEPVMTISDIPF